MNLVIIPFHDYKKWVSEGYRTRDAHLCQHFANSETVDKILVINRPTSLAERIIKRKRWNSTEGQIIYRKKRTQLLKVSEKVYCLDIKLNDFAKVIIERKQWWFSAFKNSFVIETINEAINYLKIENNILLLQNPMAIGAAEGVIRDKFVFDAIDNWLYHPQMKNKDIIRNNYKYVEEHADLILTVSKALKKTFERNSNVYWIPNGVDVVFFRTAIKKLGSDSRPIVGYVGKIQERVDFDLIEKCLIRYKDVEFRFIGPIYAQGKRIRELSKAYTNVNFRGDVHYNDLPACMKEFDICIIPHRVDEFTSSMNPLKLYEYLASGKPVISTEVAGTEGISDFVYCAGDENQFIDAIEIVLNAEAYGEINPLEIVNSIPRDCLWSSRVNEIIRLINLLSKGEGRKNDD